MSDSDTFESNVEQSQETIEAPHVAERADLTVVHQHASALMDAAGKCPGWRHGCRDRC